MKKLMYFLVLVLFTANIGYSQVTTLWENSAATSNLPAWFSTGNGERGLAYGSVAGNDRVYVVSRSSTFGNNIYIYNATNGDSVGLLNTTGISGGLFIINDVEVSSNGVIYVCNMTTDASGATNPFKVYRYTAETDTPVAVISYNTTVAVRLGDKFTVTGSTADNSVTIWAASGNTKELYKFTTTDNGVTFTPTIIQLPSLGTVSLGSAAVGPLPNGDFYYNAGGQPAQKFLADGTIIDTVSTGIIATGTNAIRFMSTPTTDEFFATYAYGPTNETGRIVKIPGGDLNLAELIGVTPILGTNSNAGGTGDLSIQLVSPFIYNIYVLGTNNGFGAYQVDFRTPLAGDYFIPQGANPQGFPTLFDAVASLNVNGALGTVNFLLDADTLRENTFTFDADLSVDNNVVVKPAPGRNVVLFVTAGASQGNGIQMIGFNKGYVTFDGSNDGSNSRNLIISTEQDAVAVPFGLNTANADTVTLKNLEIKNIVEVPLNFRYGAVINDVGGVLGFHVENCQIGTPEKPVRRDGLAPWGGGATPNSFTFLNNEIYAGVRGITTIYLIDSEIRGNTINLIPTGLTGGTDAYNHGMYITGAQGAIDINENVINCLTKTTNASSYMIGIAFAGNSEGGTDWINIFNNMINVGAADETRSTYGIGLRSSLPMGNLKIYHNTIVTNDNASTLVSYGIGNHTNGTGPVNIDLKNNIIINRHNGNTGSSAIGLIPATSVLVSDYNDLYSTQNLVNFTGTLYADLTAWQATSQDLNSVSKMVNFVSATDLHLTGASIGDFDLAGIGLPEVPFDIDGDTRHPMFPYMGADEGSVPLPVELTSFAAAVVNGKVNLTWTTASEINNQGFEIERRGNADFEKIGFVPGTGTTTQGQSYSFIDDKVIDGVYSYRLKQVDFDGSFNYSNVIEVDVTTPLNFDLSQNYPNPFNPATVIEYSIASPVNVTLTVYTILGEQVAVLVNNQFTEAGKYSVNFNASNLASGTYIYRLQAGDFVSTRKMLLTK
ncbi:MAG TPA: T9SS type A sorting domain-containing protein [Ignavibacteriaceae bacterium]|nr:T9SS type A sorting domain-containing protein [Ignavibacteriaceae bacterium]